MYCIPAGTQVILINYESGGRLSHRTSYDHSFKKSQLISSHDSKKVFNFKDKVLLEVHESFVKSV